MAEATLLRRRDWTHDSWWLRPCRKWTGPLSRGYGKCWYKGRHWRVHRAEWDQKIGPIPPGMHVLHHCDEPSCYEITHLFLGTHRDNMQDMIDKGRYVNPKTLLTDCSRCGRPLTPGNLVLSTWKKHGHRDCLYCRNARRRARRAAGQGVTPYAAGCDLGIGRPDSLGKVCVPQPQPARPPDDATAVAAPRQP